MLARASLLAALLACGSTSPDVVARRAGDAGPMDGSLPEVCGGSGPLVQVGDGLGRTRCGAEGRRPVFRHALCTCAGASLATGLVADAFDAREGPFVAGRPGGSVGVNGALDASDDLQVGGSLRVFGRTTVGSSLRLDVGETFVAGEDVAAGTLRVGRSLRAASDLRVARLETPAVIASPAAAVSIGDASGVGRTLRADVEVERPCGCDEAAFLDVRGVVETALAEADGQDVDPEELANLEAPRTLALPCGAYAFTRVGGAGLVLELSGRTALFVAGDLSLEGSLEVRLDGAGELDLFIAGNVVGQGRFLLGEAADAGRVRVYVGGSGTVNLGNGGVLAGSLYAPRAELVSPAALEVFGSVFVRRVATSGLLTVHYDEAARAGACPDDVTPCVDAGECGTRACVAGLCTACAGDDACDAPRVCGAGACDLPPP